MPLSSLHLSTSLGLDHLSIFLGLLLNMGLSQGRNNQFNSTTVQPITHRGQNEIHTGTSHPMIQQQGLRAPPSFLSFPSSLFWHHLCDNRLADLSLGSHFALLGFFPSVLAPQTGVESTSLEPRLWLLNVPWSLHALVSLGFCSNMDSATISTLLLEVVGAEGRGVPGRKAESGLLRGLGFSPAVEDILVLPPAGLRPVPGTPVRAPLPAAKWRS